MMLVPHYIASSNIEGVGLFAAANIAEGTRIYQFDYRFVMIISDAEIRTMPDAAQQAVLKYSYRGKGRERLVGAVYYCADDSRYFNHSNFPNTRWVEGEDVYIATADIPAHTEITCNYGEFTEPGDWAIESVNA
ncbi:MAG: SET domain-containing protein [Nevskia sp.]|jgi:uncharacterized protein|nr:SET domain-containing protein [Nevskia sp.]